jgi:hypothetical protein
MSSKVSSGKNHDHSESKPAGGYAGTGGSANAKPGTQGSKNSGGAGNQQSGAKDSESSNKSSDAGSGKQ